jgi:hypothetical protein
LAGEGSVKVLRLAYEDNLVAGKLLSAKLDRDIGQELVVEETGFN